MSKFHPSDVRYPDTGLLIGSSRVQACDGGMHTHIFPGSGLPTRDVVLAGPDEMDAAVQAARQAFPAWSRAPVNVRRDALLRLAKLMEDHAEELERLAVAENGITLAKARIFRYSATDSFRYYAGWADKICGDVLPSWPVPGFDYTKPEPYGVVAMIIPWNVPLGALGQILAGALAAGNAVIVKPSELAPFTCLRIGELCLEAGMPPGVVNIVPSGPAGAEALVRHTGIDKLHFTGSGATARKIVQAIDLTPLGLELGGKSARLLFADADMDAAIQATVASVLSNAGQGCLLGTRLLVEESIHDEVVEKCRSLMESYIVGDPFSPETQVGPVITEAARSRILETVDQARRRGDGRLVTGGTAIDRDGYYLEPTMFCDVDNSSPLAQEEIFGPVLAVSRFATETQAIEMANHSTFGLGAYLHTRDLNRAHRVAADLEAGNVWVNGFNVPSSVPFGGTKQSGYGRVGGKEGLHEFLRTKNVWIAS